MKVAIVHYWLVAMRGGERVVEALCELFPDADIFTHVYDPSAISETIRAHSVSTSFIQRLPGARRHYQKYLPLMPAALEGFDLTGYDLVISSESGPAKGVVVSPETVHVCYCHTPMRYVWHMYHFYTSKMSRPLRALSLPILHYLRLWDFSSAARVDHFVANSHTVRGRIRKYYRRDATVIPPPVDVDRFVATSRRESFYLVVGQLTRYKRVDIAIEAFNRLGKPLVVIGGGEEFRRLKKQAAGNVRLLGRQPSEVLRDHYERCRALVFPGEEDFGIVPIEAMAAGCPVIAYGKGGASETVIDGSTGILFPTQTAEALTAAVRRFEEVEHTFSSEAIARHASQFSRDHFRESIMKFLEKAVGSRLEGASLRVRARTALADGSGSATT